MAATLSPVPKLQFFDANGAPLAGGKLYSYFAGTTTPQSTYTDSTGITSNPNPVILDARGEAGVWLANDAFYKLSLYTSTNVLVWTVDQIASNTTLAALAASGGSALIGYLPAGTGAIATTVQTKLRETVSVFDFMTAAQIADVKANTALIDVAAAIQAAINYAYTSVITQTVFDDYGWQSRGGMTVELPAGKYLISAGLVLRPNVSLKGSGKSSTCVYGTFNAPFFTTALPTKAGEYGLAGISVYDLMVLGNKTGIYQGAFDLLRPVGMKMTGVVINSVGGNGMILRETSNSTFTDLEIANCGNDGLIITYGDAPGLYPSNANTFISPRILYNDGHGISFLGAVNGNTFIGGSVERNGYATSGVGFYNVNVACASYQPNHFIDLWTEGPCDAHVYVNSVSGLGQVVKLTGWKHFGDGTTNSPNRALIVDSGYVLVTNPTASSVSYKIINGSNSPFRLKKAGSAAVIYLQNPTGATISVPTNWIEDENGNHNGLYGLAFSNGSNFISGPQTFYNDNGGGDGVAYKNDARAHPWYQSRSYYGDILLGDGNTAPDAGFLRVAANQLGPRSGDFFNVGGAWNGSHLVMGSYRLWVDATGDLRIKSGAPSSDTDGTVVGTQT